MKELTLAEHRARIRNINSAEANNLTYLRRYRIRDYMPGQAVYNLGDYPKRFSIEPTEYDYNMLKDMAEKGVKLIQIHEEWNDSIRHLGADKFSSFDPNGLKHFVELCHSFGLKIIPYISSGYFHLYDPDFREEFSLRENNCATGVHFLYRRCSASSAHWREYLLPRTFRVLDQYGFDGIYNDWGYDSFYKMNGFLQKDGIGNYDPDIEDLVSTIYSEVKRRGGTYKIHCDFNDGPPCIDRVYDYLWIGEGMKESSAGAGKTFRPYVVPCQDKARFNLTPLDEYFAKVIPFMQFPLLTTRWRPLMGMRIEEDVPFYNRDLSDLTSEYALYKRIAEHMKAHPEGPYIYSLWSSVPDDPGEYDCWCKYLSLYRPMVEENSVAYIELRDCRDILSPLPENIYASMFVNEDKYLVVSNLTQERYELCLRDTWVERITGEKNRVFYIESGKIIFLKFGGIDLSIV